MNPHPPKKRIGELLKDRGVITEDHIKYALQVQKVTGDMLGEILEKLGFVTETDTVKALAEQSQVPYLDLDSVLVDSEILKKFNKQICLNNLFLPFQRVDGHIKVAAYNIQDEKLERLISKRTGLVPQIFIAERTRIINAINKYFYFLENPIEMQIETELKLLSQDTEMARGTDKFIRLLLHLAIKRRATDFHIQPMKESINISFRIDGVMTPIISLPPGLDRIVTSLKMKADMDIAEQRLPQDGRFSASILNNQYEFRASTTVSPHGQNMVLRILPMQTTFVGMEQLGFFKEHIHILDKMFCEPFGIILLTGPTGSGKSTTLYAGIRRLNLMEKNVMTVEEPIEYEIPLLRQTQVNVKAGYTFANAVRFFLRHDPDVMLVGEIRDKETASAAITASTTGHLVLSTLHTNTAVGVIPRLKDLGIQPFLIADSLVGVVSQRLVRKICANCRTAYQPSDQEKAYLKQPDLNELFKGEGCEICGGTGYFGRTLVYELLTIDQQLAGLIGQNADMGLIEEKYKNNGFVDIFSITAAKVTQGITSTEEAGRVLGQIRQTRSDRSSN
jgi:type II secretory ATPase GspE/PulE/Tfp pilus assembly ATPase PilB-like protein